MAYLGADTGTPMLREPLRMPAYVPEGPTLPPPPPVQVVVDEPVIFNKPPGFDEPPPGYMPIPLMPVPSGPPPGPGGAPVELGPDVQQAGFTSPLNLLILGGLALWWFRGRGKGTY